MMTDKTITKEQLDAIQKDLESKQEEAISKARSETETKIRAEYEAKAKEAETKTKEERLEAQLKELRESQDKIKNEMEERLAKEKAEFEQKLSEAQSGSGRVASNDNPFNTKKDVSKPSVEDLDLSEVDEMSARNFAQAFGIPVSQISKYK